MDIYLVSSSLLLVSFFIFLFLKRITSPRQECESHLPQADEKAPVRQEISVPGDSPAYYTGDTSQDVLEIEALDLTPNPPVAHFILKLRGTIKESIGQNPRLYTSVYLNGHLGPTVDGKLCANDNVKIIQNDVPLSDDEVPTKGKVTISYENIIPYTWLKNGWYAVRVEMYASEEVGKARLAGFEGGVEVKGGKGDGCGGW